MESEDEESPIHLLHSICLSDSFSVKIHRSVGESGLIGSLIVNGEEFKFSNYHKLDFKYRPKVNTLVSALHGKNWYRGLIYEKADGDIKVALVDYGTIVKPKALCPLPPEDGSNCGTAVRVSFTNGIPNLADLVGTKINVIRIDEIEEDTIFCSFESFGDACVIPWEPSFEDLPEKTFAFEPEMEVTVSTFFTTRSVYLQPFDQSVLVKILDDLNEHCEKSFPLTRLPFCGELVACLYDEDGVYYRAKVSRIENEQYYVRFVDFGTYEKFSLENMFLLPEEIKKVPYQAIKVGIEGLPQSNFNCPATQLFNLLTFKRIKLQLDYEKDLDNVKLSTKSGTINEKLENCMMTFMMRNLKGLNPGKIFKKHDLIYQKWKAGDELLIEAIKPLKDSLIVWTKTSEFFDDLEDLAEKINVYCNNYFSLDFYTPALDEVCLGKPAEDWCRAICLQVSGDDSELFFIDYGTQMKLSNTNIRPIIHPFMTFPVAFKECIFYGSDDLSPTLKVSILTEFQLQEFDAVVVEDFGRKVVVFARKFNDFLKQNELPEIVQPPICNL